MEKFMRLAIRSMILDMDGVLWRGNDPIGDLPDIFTKISRLGYQVTLVTNNSTLSATQYVEKLAGFGVDIASSQIVNSGLATVRYLSQIYPDGGPIFIIGEQGLINTLKEKEFYHSVEGALAVVVGLDRTITYEKLSEATLLIRSGVSFIATNPDRTFPTPDGQVPGAGSITAALEAATDVKPRNIGKPEPDMYILAMERMKSSPQATLVVGDRLETDIAGAQILGCQTGLVLSGVTGVNEARKWSPAPDIIADNLDTLLDKLLAEAQ
jgi:4-nitrophenyl phosphatase